MRNCIKMAILSIMGFSISISNVSADIKIKCPLDQARRTITDNLPKGWWTTPVVSRLSEAKISRIGGKPALVCVYGSSGSVQRNVPKRHTCKAGKRGFRCASVVSRPPTSSTKEKIFAKPTHKGYRLDWCRIFERDCGQPAAKAFCKSKGYKISVSFSKENDFKKKTMTIGQNSICDPKYHGCDTFKWIKCRR